MNANQIISMVIRMVMRRALKSGVDAGINAVGNRTNRGKPSAEGAHSPDTADTTKRAKQTMRVARKIGRM